MYKLILNTPLTTLNDYSKAERGSKYGAASLKKNNENKICILASALRFKLPNNKRFHVVIEWYNYRQDPDNVEFAQKFIFDALQKLNVIENDNKTFIGHKCHLHLKDKQFPKMQNVIFFDDIEEFKEYIINTI